MSESWVVFRREAARRTTWGGLMFRAGYALPNATQGFLVSAGTIKGCLACDTRLGGRRLGPGEVLECPACGAWYMGSLTSLPQDVDPQEAWEYRPWSRVVPSPHGASPVEGSGDRGRPGDDPR